MSACVLVKDMRKPLDEFRSLEIARSIKQEICLNLTKDEHVLTEATVAKRYNISRAPVRQIFQTLAHDRLVELRPRVGTIVVPLERAKVIEYLQATTSLLRLAAENSEHPLPSDLKFQLFAIYAEAKDAQDTHSADDLKLDVMISTTDKFLEVVADLIKDPIIRSALRAAWWRAARARCIQANQYPAFVWERFVASIDAAVKVCDSKAAGSIFFEIATCFEETGKRAVNQNILPNQDA